MSLPLHVSQHGPNPTGWQLENFQKQECLFLPNACTLVGSGHGEAPPNDSRSHSHGLVGSKQGRKARMGAIW